MDPEKHEKPLWEYDHMELFEVPLNHKAQTQLNSWNEFIEDANGARQCNCMCNSPLLYWYWVENDGSQDSEGDILNLIFAMWFSEVTRFEIKVDRVDEPKIRLWIREQQRKIAV
jgi:hypothetical protein